MNIHNFMPTILLIRVYKNDKLLPTLVQPEGPKILTTYVLVLLIDTLCKQLGPRMSVLI